MQTAPGPRIESHWTLGVRYRNFNLDHVIRQQSWTFPDLGSQTDLSQDSNFFGVNVGLGVSVAPPGGESGFVGGVNVFAAPGVLFTSADATQLSHCGPCGLASPEFNVVLQRDFSRSDFSAIAGASVHAGYRFGQYGQISLFANVDHMTRVPVFNVPTTPVQQPINFDGRDSLTNVTVGGRLGLDLHAGYGVSDRIDFTDRIDGGPRRNFLGIANFADFFFPR